MKKRAVRRFRRKAWAFWDDHWQDVFATVVLLAGFGIYLFGVHACVSSPDEEREVQRTAVQGPGR